MPEQSTPFAPKIQITTASGWERIVCEERRFDSDTTVIYTEEFDELATFPGWNLDLAVLKAAASWADRSFERGQAAGRRGLKSDLLRLLGLPLQEAQA